MSDLGSNSMRRYLKLAFFGVAPKVEVDFTAFLENIEDSFDSEWDQNSVYGRMDPIGSFKATVRTISLAWTVPSTGYEDARDNMYKTQTLASMLYPVYKEQYRGRHAAIKSAPMFKVKFANLITVPRGASKYTKEGTARRDGLLCAISGFKFDPVMEEGFFHGDDGVFPQSLKFSCSLQIYHENKLGWSESKVLSMKRDEVLLAPQDFDKIEDHKRSKGFPYGMKKLTAIPKPKSSSGDNKRSVQDAKSESTSRALTNFYTGSSRDRMKPR